jgi:hypothetical protein
MPPLEAGTVFSTTVSKIFIFQDPESMKTVAGTLNLIVNTASAKHDLNAYLDLLARYKALTLTRHNPITISLIFQKRFKLRLDICKTQYEPSHLSGQVPWDF